MPYERYPPNRICSTKIYWKNAWIVWIDLLFKPYPFSWGRGLVPWAHLSRPKPAYDRFSRFCTIHRVHRTHTTISATLVAIGHIWHPAIHGEMRGKTNITQKSEETIWVIRNALGECTLAALDDRGSSKSAHILGLNRCQQVVLMSRRQDLGPRSWVWAAASTWFCWVSQVHRPPVGTSWECPPPSACPCPGQADPMHLFSTLTLLLRPWPWPEFKDRGQGDPACFLDLTVLIVPGERGDVTMTSTLIWSRSRRSNV